MKQFTIFWGMLFAAEVAFAHTPYMACYDNGDKTVSCFAEFSDGTSAAGNKVRVVDSAERILLQGTIDETGEYSFERPTGDFTVIFDAGPGHIVKEKSSTIIP